jgi:thiamine biosynthesis lipoprotein
MNRRDFLQPTRLAEAATRLVNEEPELACDEAAALLQVAARAMATTFEVIVPWSTQRARTAATSALALIDDLEEQLSVYKEASEVSEINRRAAFGPLVVERRLFDLFVLANEITTATAGAFDITAGPLIRAWGFYNRSHRLPPARERREILKKVGMEKVKLDLSDRTIAFARPGVEINLGSIGKGYALDRAAEVLRSDWNVPAALIHGGKSSILAIGASPSDKRGWPVGICHPWVDDRRLGVVYLKDQALATSAATFQHLRYGGRNLGHILDPRTGWPAEGMASTSAVAPTAAQADALSTAFFILGVEPTRAYCAAHQEVGAIMLPSGTGARPVIIGLDPQLIHLHTELN